MNTQNSGAVDMLDILFEHRNKSYGAYVLRRGYDRRVVTGLLGSLVLAGFFAWMLRSGTVPPALSTDTLLPRGPVTLVEAVFPPPPVEPPRQERQPASARTIQDLTPTIVPDQVRIDHPVPTTDELSEALPGTETQEGVQDGTVIPAGTSVQGGVSALPAENKPVDNLVYSFAAVEVQAAFPGGDKALRRFLEKNLQTPEAGGEGASRTVKVMVKFIIDAEGRPGSYEQLQSGGPAFDAEVNRVLGRMPNWTPARQNGRNVAMYFILPVVFSLDTED